MENTLLNQALSSKDHIEDPYERVKALMSDWHYFYRLKINNSTKLSETEIDEQLEQKNRLMVRITVDNLDEMEEKAKEVRKSWSL